MGTLTNSGKLIEKIESKQDELTAGEGIEIGTVQDYSAMRGPCPEGFHIWSEGEFDNYYSILNTLSITTAQQLGEYLKIPKAGFYTKMSGQDDPYLNTGYIAIIINKRVDTYNFLRYWGNSGVGKNSYGSMSNAYSIRPMKDIPVIPDSSWTMIYDGSSVAIGAGVFHNATLGLISLSSDGINWVTISDKNLGATTVYNYGDTLSEANCGKFYQYGNNYGFPRDSSLWTVSTTAIDATGYGPGNYYESSTYIFVGPRDSSNPINKNLRGGVTGIVTLNNAITNIGVLSVNGQTGNVTIPAGSEIVYCTQAEYEALPSSKLTDGKSYVIYE